MRATRLLRAELRKLRRPLVIWTAIAVIALVGLLAWGGQKSIAQQFRYEIGLGPPPTCGQVGLPEGPDCQQQLQQILRDQRNADRQARRERNQEAQSALEFRDPLGAGGLAAGMAASLFGCAALLLLAAGHVGNEWSGKTIKSVLTHEGRRGRVLAAKVVSLWLLGVGLLLVLWVVLAALGPVFASAYRLPGLHLASGAAARLALPAVARSLLVLAAFAVLGALAAVITRNTLGSFFLAFAFVVASLILAGFRRVSHLTLASWVAGWMGFRTQGFVADHVWRDSFDPAKFPTRASSFLGLLAFTAICAGLAWLRVERSDVKV